MTAPIINNECMIPISTHTPLAGRDFSAAESEKLHRKISTHTPLAGRDGNMNAFKYAGSISTHTPLAGRDENWATEYIRYFDFYSHAPCGT